MFCFYLPWWFIIFRALKKSLASFKSYFLPRRTPEGNGSCELWCLPHCALCTLPLKSKKIQHFCGTYCSLIYAKEIPTILSPPLFVFMFLGGEKERKEVNQWLLCLSSSQALVQWLESLNAFEEIPQLFVTDFKEKTCSLLAAWTKNKVFSDKFIFNIFIILRNRQILCPRKKYHSTVEVKTIGYYATCSEFVLSPKQIFNC